MRPCSAYCKPEEGLHVGVNWYVEGLDGTGDVGSVQVLEERDYWCLPCETRVLVVGAEPAKEAGESPTPSFSNPVLMTLRVLEMGNLCAP